MIRGRVYKGPTPGLASITFIDHRPNPPLVVKKNNMPPTHYSSRHFSDYVPPNIRYKRTRVSAKAPGNLTALTSLVKRIISKKETYHRKVVDEADVTTADTQALYSLNLTGNIPEGVSDGARVGDEIHLSHMSFKLYCNAGSAASNAATSFFRCIIYMSTQEFEGGSDAFGTSGPISSEIFVNTGVARPAEQGILDNKSVNVLFDKTITLSPQIGLVAAPGAMSTVYNGMLKLNRSFVYQTGTDFGKYQSMYVTIIPDVSGQNSGFTSSNSFFWSSCLYFKNNV